MKERGRDREGERDGGRAGLSSMTRTQPIGACVWDVCEGREGEYVRVGCVCVRGKRESVCVCEGRKRESVCVCEGRDGMCMWCL